MIRTFLASAVWLILVDLSSLLGNTLHFLSDWSGWSLLGWAFGGSTAYVVYEVIEQKKRSGRDRLLLIVLGMFLSMAFSDSLSGFIIMGVHLDQKAATVITGLLAYIGLGKLLKRAQKAKSLTDLTEDK